MVSSTGEIPEKARMPKRDLETPMPVCQGIALARRHGWIITMGEEDISCPVGAVALGLLPAKAKFFDGSFAIPSYVKSQEVRAKIHQGIPRLEQGRYTHLVIAPLNRAEFEPQVIIVYGNAAQISRLIQAAVVGTGKPITSSSFGYVACPEEIARPILTDQCQFVVAGGGVRMVAHTQDHELSFAMPISKAEAIAEQLKVTHEAGARYPTNPILTYKVPFPRGFVEFMDYLRQDD